MQHVVINTRMLYLKDITSAPMTFLTSKTLKVTDEEENKKRKSRGAQADRNDSQWDCLLHYMAD